MNRKTARCIAIHSSDGRCRRRAGKRSGDLYLCGRHGVMVWMEADGLRPAQRRLLAHARWRTHDEAQALVNAMVQPEAR